MRVTELKTKKVYLYTGNVEYIPVEFLGKDAEGYKFQAIDSGVTNHLSMDDVHRHIEN